MQIGQVGQELLPGQAALEEKILYRLDCDGHGLLIVKERVCNQDVDNIQNAGVELGIYIDGPIIFLLFKFGKGPWNDAPYSWHTVPRESRVYPEEAADAGTLRIALAETGAGIIRAVRNIAFTQEFADKLNTAITVQANGSFNGLSYAKHINMVYNQYTSEDMIEMAAAHMKVEK